MGMFWTGTPDHLCFSSDIIRSAVRRWGDIHGNDAQRK